MCKVWGWRRLTDADVLQRGRKSRDEEELHTGRAVSF